MKRAAIERSRTKTIWRKHWNKHVRQKVAAGGQTPIACLCDRQIGRFRKGQRQGGCGRPQCHVCHADKLLGVPRHRDRKQALRERDHD